MRFTRARWIPAFALGAILLLAAWPAAGQQDPLVAEPGGNSAYRMWGGGGPRDRELDKLIAAENAAAREVATLVAEYGRTEEEAPRAKIKEKLSAALAKQFDAQQKRRELELVRAEAKLKKLRELMKKRGEERRTIIDKRIDQLIREAEGLGWSPPPGPRAGGYTANRYGSGAPAK
jgi:hypothetical protein